VQKTPWKCGDRAHETTEAYFYYSAELNEIPLTSTAVFILYIRSSNSIIKKFATKIRRYVTRLLLKSRHLQGNTVGVFRRDDNKMKYYGSYKVRSLYIYDFPVNSILLLRLPGVNTALYYFNTTVYKTKKCKLVCPAKLKT